MVTEKVIACHLDDWEPYLDGSLTSMFVRFKKEINWNIQNKNAFEIVCSIYSFMSSFWPRFFTQGNQYCFLNTSPV